MALDVARTTAQLRSRLAEFSAPQKTIIVLLAIVGIVAAGAFGRWVTAPSYGVLMAGLEPTDAAAVTAQLDGAGVPYELEAGGTTVLVPNEQLQAQRLAVAAAGLPHGTTKGYELLDGQSMTASSFQQQIAFQRAVEGELSKTLGQITDVRTATVHLSLPEDELYTDKATPARASVLLDTRRTLPGESVDSVQRLVAASVPDLVAEDVTVSDTKGNLLSSAGGAASGKEAEQALEDAAVVKADTMLASVLGEGKAVVRVNAEMDATTKSTEKETYDPKGTVTLRKDASKEVYNTEGTAPGGVVSVPDPGAVGTGSGNGQYNKDDSKTEFGVTRQVDKSSVQPGALKRLTIAVALDSQGNPPARQVVQDLVANAVGLDTKRGDTISVAVAPFSADAAPAEVAPARDWMRIGTVAFAVLLLLLVAVALLRALRRGQVQEIPLETLALPPVDEQLALEGPRVRPVDTSLQDAADQDARILELVDSRPDEVGVLIRNWLSEPAEIAK